MTKIYGSGPLVFAIGFHSFYTADSHSSAKKAGPRLFSVVLQLFLNSSSWSFGSSNICPCFASSIVHSVVLFILSETLVCSERTNLCNFYLVYSVKCLRLWDGPALTEVQYWRVRTNVLTKHLGDELGQIEIQSEV